MLRSLVLVTALMGAPAWAADCEPVSPDAFSTLADDAANAVLEPTYASFDTAADAMRAAVPCLEGPVDPAAWAWFVYHQAVSHFPRDVPWEDDVAAALEIDPELARVSFPELRTYEPPPADETWVVPEPTQGLTFYADGHPAGHVFSLRGPHLLQVHDGTAWENVLVEDGRLPTSWRLLATSASPDDVVETPVVADAPVKVQPVDDTPVEPAPAPAPAPTPAVTSTAPWPKGVPKSAKVGKGLVSGGIAGMVIGPSLALSAIAAAQLNPVFGTIDPNDQGSVYAVQAIEVTGWTLAGAGLGMVIAGAVLNKKHKKATAAQVTVVPTGPGMQVVGTF